MNKKILLSILSLSIVAMLLITGCAESNLSGKAKTRIGSTYLGMGNPQNVKFYTLREGETQTYQIAGQEFEITLNYVSDPGQPETARFIVNGEVSSTLSEGETAILASGELEVLDIMVNSREGVATFTFTPPPLRTLREGKTQTYEVDGVSYKTTLNYVSDPGQPERARFIVNGEVTSELAEGWSTTLTWGTLKVLDIMVNSREGVASFTFMPAPKHTLREGETQTYTITGQEFEITLNYVSDPGQPETARFIVNGEVTETLSEGGAATLATGTLRVLDIMVNKREGVASFTFVPNE